jgi:hypothetical protein
LRLFGRLSEDSSPVYRIVDNFTNRGSVWVYIHAIAGAQMPENSLRGNFRGDAYQFRITPRLNMIDSKNPLIQRQMSIKSHDYLFPSRNRPRGQF